METLQQPQQPQLTLDQKIERADLNLSAMFKRGETDRVNAGLRWLQQNDPEVYSGVIARRLAIKKSQEVAIARDSQTQRVQAYLANPNIPVAPEDSSAYVDADDNRTRITMSEAIQRGIQGQHEKGVIGAKDVFMVYRHPVITAGAMLNAFGDMLQYMSNEVIRTDFDIEDEEATKTMLTAMTASVGAAAIPALVGGMVAGPPGAVVGTALGLIGSFAAPAYVMSREEDIPFTQSLTREVTSGAILAPVGITAGVGLRLAGRAGRAAFIANRATRDMTIVDDVVDATVVANAAKGVTSNRPVQFADIDTAGYTIYHNVNGTIDVVDPTTKKAVLHGIVTPEELRQAIPTLKPLTQSNPTVGPDLPTLMHRNAEKPVGIADKTERVIDAFNRNLFTQWLTVAKESFEVLERLIFQDTGKVTPLVTEIFIPLQRASIRFNALKHGMMKALEPILNIDAALFKNMTGFQIASRRTQLGQWIKASLVEESRASLTAAEKVFLDKASPLIAKGADVRRASRYAADAVEKMKRVTDPTKLGDTRTKLMATHKVESPDDIALATLLEELANLPTNQASAVRIVELLNAQQGRLKPAVQLAKDFSLTSAELAYAQQLKNLLVNRGYHDYSRMSNHVAIFGYWDNFHPSRTTAPSSKIIGTMAEYTQARQSRSLWMSGNDPLQDLKDSVVSQVWADTFGLKVEESKILLREALKGVDYYRFKTGVVNRVQFFLEEMKGALDPDVKFIMSDLKKALPDDTAIGKLWQSNLDTAVEVMATLATTGLLGHKPYLGLRDMVSTWIMYGVHRDFYTSLRAINREYKNFLSMKGVKPRTKWENYKKDVTGPLELAGKIAGFEHGEFHEALDPRRVNPGVMRTVTRIARAYEASGEYWSYQPQLFSIHQVAIYKSEIGLINKTLKKFKLDKIQSDQAIRDKILVETRALYQSDATIQQLNKMLVAGDLEGYSKLLAELVNLDVMGRFGHAAGPAGARGPVPKMLFNLRTFPAVTKAQITKWLTRGTKAQRRWNVAKMVAAEGFAAFTMPKIFSSFDKFSHSGYFDPFRSVLYAGGPLFNIFIDAQNEFQMAPYRDEPAVSSTLDEFAADVLRAYTPYPLKLILEE